MAKRAQEIEGNAQASSQAFTKQVLRMGEMLMRVEGITAQLDEDYVYITHINVKFPQLDKPDFFVIVKANGEDGPLVAFHSAPDFAGALVGTLERLHNRSIKWREDKPYGS